MPNTFEDNLRREYVEGRIEVEDFERRLAAILQGEPLEEDRQLAARTIKWGPGVAIPHNPAKVHFVNPPKTETEAQMWRQRKADTRLLFGRTAKGGQ